MAFPLGQQCESLVQNKQNSKSIVFLKLTDSSLKVVEEYAKNTNHSSKPTIQFGNFSGVISLPYNDERQPYGFTFSNIEANAPNGKFECIQQTQGCLESLGSIVIKMQIHANEDSYENTKFKMAAAEKQQKQSGAKEIKTAGSSHDRLLIRGNSFKKLPVNVGASPLIQNKVPTNKGSMSNYSPFTSNTSAVKKAELPKPSPNKGNIELMRQPIRDRIIHILALRPYKKPELIVKLKYGGMWEKDRHSITSVLSQVGVLKKNAYHLADHLWNEVQDNWKFYSPEDAEIVQRKKEFFCQSDKNLLPNRQPSTSPLQKSLTSTEETYEQPNGKKKRISHFSGSFNQGPSKESPKRSESPKSEVKSIEQQTVLPATFPKPCNDQKNVEKLDDRLVQLSSPSYKANESNSTTFTSKSSSVMINKNSSERIPSSSKFFHPECRRKRTNQSSTSYHSSGVVSADQCPAVKSFSSGSKVTTANQMSSVEHPNFGYERQSTIHGSDMQLFNYKHKANKISPFGTSSQAIKSSRFSPPDKTSCSKYKIDSSHKFRRRSRSLESMRTDTAENLPRGSSRPMFKVVHGEYSSLAESSMLRSNSETGTRNKLSSSAIPPADSKFSEKESHPVSSMQFTDRFDYKKQYCKVVSPEQRKLYKEHFDAEFPEYLDLHKKVRAVSEVFEALGKRRASFQEGTKEYDQVESEIYAEYYKCQEDPYYISARDRCVFLQQKLGYIKQLVEEYDAQQLAKS